MAEKPNSCESSPACVVISTPSRDESLGCDPADYAGWLDSTTPMDRLLPLLDSRPIDGLEVIAANPQVNNPRNEGPGLLTPAV